MALTSVTRARARTPERRLQSSSEVRERFFYWVCLRGDFFFGRGESEVTVVLNAELIRSGVSLFCGLLVTWRCFVLSDNI